MPEFIGPMYYSVDVDHVTWTVPERYQNLDIIGVGTFGAVCRAMDTETGRAVAIKKIAYPVANFARCHHTYREIRILRQIDSRFIIDLLDLFTPDGGPDTLKDIYMVSSLMEADLHRILQIQRLSDDHIRFVIYQILCGLKYLHSADIIHRDLKPNNFGVNENCRLRILDFGMARPIDKKMTGYVSMRWYRAPEIMYNWMSYRQTADIWSVGCVLAEMLLGRPLFPGRDQIEQFSLICQLLGSPGEELVNKMHSTTARAYIRNYSLHKPGGFAEKFPHASSDARDLLSNMLAWDPEERFSAEQCLEHPYFSKYHNPAEESTVSPIDFHFDSARYTLPEWKATLWNEVQTFQEEKAQSSP